MSARNPARIPRGSADLRAAEAALLASGDAPCNEVNYGWVKLLTESRIQFDIVERETPWEKRYALLVLPENAWVDEALAARIHAFVAGGGAALVAHTAGLLAGTQNSWLDRYGLHYAGPSPFTPAYMVPPQRRLACRGRRHHFGQHAPPGDRRCPVINASSPDHAIQGRGVPSG